MSYNKNMFALLNKDTILVVVHVYDNKSGRITESTTKPLTYKALRQQNIAVGDRVVVQMGERTYVKTVREIQPVNELRDDAIEYKWVISRVDATLYHQVMEKERLFNAKLLQLARENEAKKLRAELSAELGVEGVALLSDMTVIDGTAVPVNAELPEDSDARKE